MTNKNQISSFHGWTQQPCYISLRQKPMAYNYYGKNSILDVWQGSEYPSAFGTTSSLRRGFYKDNLLFLLKPCNRFN